LPAFAPFDKIIITAAAPHTPPKLLEQLKTGGIMVLPRNEGDLQRMIRIIKKKMALMKKACTTSFLLCLCFREKNN